METEFAIDNTEVAAAETDDVSARFDFGQADDFTRQSFADKHMFAAPLDPARRAHASHLVTGIVPRLFQTMGKGALRRRSMARWRRLLKRLVRALLVIVPPEPVEARLLLVDSRRRRPRRLGFQRAMHALVTAVVLRRGRRNIARRDADPGLEGTIPTGSTARPHPLNQTARRCPSGWLAASRRPKKPVPACFERPPTSDR